MAFKRIVLLITLGLSFAQSSKNGFCNRVWADEFNGPALSSDWYKESNCKGGGNNEMQCYTTRNKNVFINNGDLVLRAFRETFTGSQEGCTDNEGCTWTKPYTSGRVSTRGKQAWTYGRFETRAKVASGYQLWPAIWMMPQDYKYGGWAASGEIDIMEMRGEKPSEVSGTLHHGGAWPQNVWTTTGDHSIGVDLSQAFHVYTVEWTKDYMRWYIDDVLTQDYDLNRWWNSSARNVYTAKGQPWDQSFHFILNLAVGGSFFGGAAAVTDDQSARWAQPEMRIDYVRVYQQGGDCSQLGLPSQGADNAARPTSSPPTSAPATTQTTQPTPGRCNNQGYSSLTHTCTINDLGIQVLCPVGLSSCGQACFPSNDYCCQNGNLLAKSLCRAPTAQTSAASTSPSQPNTPATSVKVDETGVCAGQRYDSNFYSCTTNERGEKKLCRKNNNSCGDRCFDTQLYCCKNGNLLQKWQC